MLPRWKSCCGFCEASARPRLRWGLWGWGLWLGRGCQVLEDFAWHYGSQVGWLLGGSCSAGGAGGGAGGQPWGVGRLN